MTTAMPIMHRPQNTTTSLLGEGLPREDIVPMTTEAESAEVMKKIASTAMSRNGVICASGSCANMSKSTCCGEAEPSKPATPSWLRRTAVPPKMVNARMRMAVGASMVTSTNSRSVRPREILAMNMPTNGVHAIHHAQ